jgi:DNA-binding XRE family transcriptional regulator
MQVMNLLRQLRKAKGLSQDQLAQAAGIGKATVQRIERGRCLPNWETAMSLAAVLDCDATSLRYGAGLAAEVSKLATISLTRDATPTELRPLPEKLREVFLDYYESRKALVAANKVTEEAMASWVALFREQSNVHRDCAAKLSVALAHPLDPSAQQQFLDALARAKELHETPTPPNADVLFTMKHGMGALEAFNAASLRVTQVLLQFA